MALLGCVDWLLHCSSKLFGTVFVDSISELFGSLASPLLASSRSKKGKSNILNLLA